MSIQTSSRSVWQRGNNNSKRLLQSLGMKDTRTIALKEWLKHRTHCNNFIEGDDFPVKICYDNMVGAFATWSDATYQVALIERKKGKRL